MFNFNKTPVTKTGLQEARDDLFIELKNFEGNTDEYKAVMVHIDTLSKLIDLEKSETLSPNTVAIVLGNVGIAAMFTWFERSGVVTTKVLPFLTKLVK